MARRSYQSVQCLSPSAHREWRRDTSVNNRTSRDKMAHPSGYDERLLQITGFRSAPKPQLKRIHPGELSPPDPTRVDQVWGRGRIWESARTGLRQGLPGRRKSDQVLSSTPSSLNKRTLFRYSVVFQHLTQHLAGRRR